MTPFYTYSDNELREVTSEEIIARAQMLMTQRFQRGVLLDKPELTKQFLRLHLGSLDYEVFGIISLDARHRLIKVEDLFRGTLNTVKIYVREIMQTVLAHGASAIICYHNHPSGVADPSENDEKMTRNIRHALEIIDVRVLDHLIVGETIFSFAEEGLIQN